MSGAVAAEATVTVNGAERPVPGGSSLADLVVEIAPEARAIAVELNGEIVPRGRWPEVELLTGDRIEIVRFVQGG